MNTGVCKKTIVFFGAGRFTGCDGGAKDRTLGQLPGQAEYHTLKQTIA